MKPLFLLSLLAGLALAGYLYFVVFDDLSESELVTLSPLWFLLLVFGAIGLKAEAGAALVAKGEAENLHDGVRKSSVTSPIVSLLFIKLPSLLYNPGHTTKSPAVYALILTLIWAALLYFFFLGVFPNL